MLRVLTMKQLKNWTLNDLIVMLRVLTIKQLKNCPLVIKQQSLTLLTCNFLKINENVFCTLKEVQTNKTFHVDP